MRRLKKISRIADAYDERTCKNMCLRSLKKIKKYEVDNLQSFSFEQMRKKLEVYNTIRYKNI